MSARSLQPTTELGRAVVPARLATPSQAELQKSQDSQLPLLLVCHDHALASLVYNRSFSSHSRSSPFIHLSSLLHTAFWLLVLFFSTRLLPVHFASSSIHSHCPPLVLRNSLHCTSSCSSDIKATAVIMFASQHLSVAALCLALFSLPTSLAQTTTIVMVSVTTTSTATATVTTTPAPAPTIDPGVGDYNYMGCYNETSNDPNAGNIRALDANSVRASSTLSPSSILPLQHHLPFLYTTLATLSQLLYPTTLPPN